MLPLPCPDDEVLAAWAAGALSAEEARDCSVHVEQCEACREAYSEVVKSLRLDTTARSAAPSSMEAWWSPVHTGEVLLGKYEIERVLGAGGMGVVVVAKHLQLNERVALKFVRRDLAGDPDVLVRFSREARAAARLKTEHICRVHDLGALPTGAPFMVMEYLEGESVEEQLKRDGGQKPEVVKQWALQMTAALIEAHSLGIVHRDLKPANLFLQRRPDSSERLKVLDFGIAKSVHPEIEEGLSATSTGFLIGSPTYMAPEQLMAGTPIDFRADIWAFGCTLYAMCTGNPPFQSNDFSQLALAIRTAPVDTDSLPEPVARIVRRCLEKDPAKRFGSMHEIAAMLTETRALRKTPYRRVIAVLGAAVVGLAAVSFLNQPEPPPVAPKEASAEPPKVEAPIVEAVPTPEPKPQEAAVQQPPDAGLPSEAPVQKKPSRRVLRGRDDSVFKERL